MALNMHSLGFDMSITLMCLI